MRVDTMNAFAEERDKEVRNILQSIGDLTTIMKDLSVLVIDQGTILDRIDYNMEQVVWINHKQCESIDKGYRSAGPRKKQLLGDLREMSIDLTTGLLLSR